MNLNNTINIMDLVNVIGKNVVGNKNRENRLI